MAIAAGKHISEGMKTLQICVNSYQDKMIEGYIYHTSVPNGVHFNNLMQMIIGVEQILDSMDFPRAATEKRRFTKETGAQALLDETQRSRKEGECATFFVRMMFRQNASWQGAVLWKEGGCELVFRSALELIMLMDSALETE